MHPSADFDLKTLRTNLDWSQKQMADFLGCCQATICRMEKLGKIKPIYLKFLTAAAPERGQPE